MNCSRESDATVVFDEELSACCCLWITSYGIWYLKVIRGAENRNHWLYDTIPNHARSFFIQTSLLRYSSSLGCMFSWMVSYSPKFCKSQNITMVFLQSFSVYRYFSILLLATKMKSKLRLSWFQSWSHLVWQAVWALLGGKAL